MAPAELLNVFNFALLHALLWVLFSFASILMWKRKPVALLCLSVKFIFLFSMLEIPVDVKDICG